MLVPYEAYITFPSGEIAPNYPVSVILSGGNQLALLFTDDTGQIEAPNPVTTDEFGRSFFWASPGNYVSWVAEEIFHYRVLSTFTLPTWPNTKIHTQEIPSSLWMVSHYFGLNPSVDIILGREESEAAITHPDDRTTTITFSSPVTGTGYFRR